MKTAVVYDNNGRFLTGKQVPDDYQLANNETFLIPDSSLLDPHFNGSSWTGVSKEDFDKATVGKVKVDDEPSVVDMIHQLGTTVAQLSATVSGVQQQLAKNGGTTNGQA